MSKPTVLYQKHLDAGGKIVDFAGWEMPINYGSQLAEHKQVREHAGVFDVSHMTIVDIHGTDALAYLRKLVTNDVAKLDVPGRALYTGMLNETGGVVDDLIVYRMQDHYRVVVNCATREKDLAWLAAVAGSFAVTQPVVGALGNFRCVELGDWFIARTGYTGEKGLEVMLPASQAPAFWDQLLAAGVLPIGLGARDTLRLEAGMNLYGHDMDESISPLAANMEQTISWMPEDRDFVGRAAVTLHKQQQLAGTLPILIGLVLESRGVLREGQKVITDKGDGIITSGTFSPTLNCSIALARVPVGTTDCHVELRGGQTAVRMVKPNFVRFGKKVFE